VERKQERGGCGGKERNERGLWLNCPRESGRVSGGKEIRAGGFGKTE
jgi:hypothetical protein